MAQAAKTARGVSAAALKDSVRVLSKFKDTANPNKRLLQQKLDKALADRQELVTVHYIYTEKAGIDPDEDDVESAWLADRVDAADLVCDEVTVMIETMSEADEQIQRDAEKALSQSKEQAEIQLAELQCKSEEKSTKERLDAMNLFISDFTHDSKADATTARSYLTQVEESLDNSIKSWSILKQLAVTQVKRDEIFAAEETLKKVVMDGRIAALSFISRVDPESSIDNRSVEGSDISTSGSRHLKTEKVQNPKFSGDIRLFARFKANFQKIVVPSCTDKYQQAYIIKRSCLQGESKKLVENIEDIDKIWERLEDRYGNTTEIVNVVLQGIQQFQFGKNNHDRHQGMVKLVDELDRGVQDLEAIEAKDEIANAYTVRILEGKLPTDVLTRWHNKDTEESDEDSVSVSSAARSSNQRFETMFKFLLRERKNAEKMLLLKPSTKPEQLPSRRKDMNGHVGGGVNHTLGNTGGGAGGGGSGGSGANKINPGNSCLIHPSSSHLTRKCHAFLSKTVEERGKIVQDCSGCKLCLSISHVGQPCPFVDKWQKCNIQGCQESHSRLLHGCSLQLSFHMHITHCDSTTPLLLIQVVDTSSGDMIIFWDNGSTIALISKRCAERNNLTGTPVMCDLMTVGGKITYMRTTLYEIELIDKNGEHHTIHLYEIDDICGQLSSMSMESLVQFFPSVTADEIARPLGEVDVLIGMEYADIYPRQMETNQGLVLYESDFGTGRIVGGKNKAITANEQISAKARLCAQVKITNVRAIKVPQKPAIDFFTSEQFGVRPPPICNNCKNCKECAYESQQLSREERREHEVIKENLKLDPSTKTWTTKYPYKCDPSVLQNNKEQVLAMSERMKKRMSNNPALKKSVDDQIEDFLRRDVLVEITKEEEEAYEGPVNYLTFHVVENPGSASTPYRLVINSSLKFRGISFNDTLMKGPNSLQNLFGIQLRFRTHLYALCCDLSKMYHSVHTTEREKHLRRIIHDGRTYGFTRAMFGDKCAAAIAGEAVRETAKIYKHIDEDAADKIIEDTYVDDSATGADETSDIVRLKENIPKIMNQGSFKVKGFVTSGDDDDEARALLGGKEVGRVLGIPWHPKADEFSVQVNIDVSERRKGSRSGSSLSADEIPQLITVPLTRRILLGITNSCYDVYGLVSPITIQLKIQLRNLLRPEHNLGWDDPIPVNLKEKWIKILELLKRAEGIRFKRSIKPKNAVGQPTLIVCSDGSEDAMCATAHVQWQVEDGSFHCALFAAKTRVTPLRKETIPRIEMQACVMGSRLSKTIQTYSELNFSEVIQVIDSMCSLATLQNETSMLREYMANRANEILSVTNVENIYHVRSKLNISDLATRTDAVVEDISPSSDWQKGPSWMRLPREHWPLTQDTGGSAVPEEEMRKVVLVAATSKSQPSIDLNRFKGRSYVLLLRTIALVYKIVNSRSFKAAFEPIDFAEIKLAERACVKMSMIHTKKELDAGRLKSLGAMINDEGIICVRSRAENAMKSHYGCEEFPILTYKDPLSQIWMTEVHNEDHSGVTRTVAKSRRKFWIVRARRLAETVKRSCYTCRVLDAELAQQKMAPLPQSRTKIAPPFFIISMDLFGPILIRDTVKKRVHKKVWGVIFNCTVTRAVHLDLTEDYGTDSILQTIRKFTSIRGCPGEIQSDQGSQLIAAAKDIAELVADWDWKPIQEWAVRRQIKWSLAPAEGPHQNGLSESLIRSVKRSIKHKVTNNNILTFSQLQMVMYEVANIINSRPIGIISGSDPEQPSSITPNDLILGRATADVPQGPFDLGQSKKTNKQFRLLQSLVDSWWKTWYETVFPYLVPSYKWLQRHRNVKIGDVCLIRYKKEIRSTYRLGRVQDIKRGADGLVRTVILKYKLPGERNFRTVDRPVQGISVIVPLEEQDQTVDPRLDVSAPEFVPQK